MMKNVNDKVQEQDAVRELTSDEIEQVYGGARSVDFKGVEFIYQDGVVVGEIDHDAEVCIAY
jgi:hypothetical protein